MKRNGKFQKMITAILVAALILLGVPNVPTVATVEAAGIPAQVTLSHNQWPGDPDGDYDITGNMWYGNNGTSFILYEGYNSQSNFSVAAQGNMSDNSPNAQSFVVNFKNKAIGTYYYYAELANSYGKSKSSIISLQVTQSTATPTITPVPTTTVTPTVIPTVTPTTTPTITPSVTPTITPPVTPTITPPVTPTITPPVTPTVTPTPTATITPTPTATPVPGGKATGVPGKPTLQHNQWGNDTDGTYDITVNMWYGNNGTSYKLYEKIGAGGSYKQVSAGALTDNSPSVQTFVIPITGRTVPGTYYYYIELANSYGSTNSDAISLKVGSADSSKIVIGTIDDDGAKNQYTVAQGTYTFNLLHVDAQAPGYTVISSNTSVAKASITDGNKLKIEAVGAGRTGLKIVETTTKEERYIGIRVKNADGSLPGLPNYVSIGQVSEDTANDLNFWKDTDTDDTNKRCDIRYIYINGGPVNGWRSWTTEDGARAKTYITESLKLGMIPYFVYYNIPDSAEDYNVDIKHINDTAYMKAYYEDLKFFLDICNQYDETFGIVLEPDFLGYMMQQSGKTPSSIAAAGVEAAYTSGILKKGVDPDFPNTVTGLVQSINYIINKTSPKAIFGWQFNTWGYSKDVPGQGLMHATEILGYTAGRAFIQNAAKETALYYMEAGITSYGADFISIDKYGLDGAYESGAVTNPAGSRWLWNADLWNNYIFYAGVLHSTTALPVTLWQLPVGHLNTSQEANPYTGGLFKELSNAVGYYEDSAPDYFFGDTFKPGSQARVDYFSSNASNDPKIKVSNGTITYGSHIEEAKAAGITCILFGAGVGASTDAVGSPPADDYWWITKAQRYLRNPVSLN
ncbi:hypothetical protein [Anaerocolumna xylanovorans]|uniref:Uncharacterized protein n=1 Tax=Anaerocolumna xylanovorans DSM 12503 TaxID=1121345 RepID=A0A1M7YCC1_9FIRM|nr:hypothetical protein [Anaerocolumna xylanovorans]SHO50284.1 hypothetical protein SAMN02745217_02671 [Anaerocolumna xylanovorans DSM 12503]